MGCVLIGVVDCFIESPNIAARIINLYHILHHIKFNSNPPLNFFFFLIPFLGPIELTFKVCNRFLNF